jgi:gamma-glutamyltranspeptidase/glutathione hydrolase
MESVRREQLDADLLDLAGHKLHRPQRVAGSRQGMVATAHYRATEAGAEILKAGGNAVDAAVAAAFALGVCEPAASGLGGQTMMLIHLADKRRTFALDGSSRAPNGAMPGLVNKPERLHGYKATTVPSTPAVLGYAVDQYGKLDLPRLLEPAIRLAEEGYQISLLQHALTRRELKKLRAGTAALFFLNEGVRVHRPGTLFRQPVLAKTLRRLSSRGINDFYSGGIARKIDQDMARNGGLVRREDLAQIPVPIERRPVSGRLGTMRVLTFPPPGAGRTLIEMLNIHEQISPAHRDLDSPEGALVLAETIRRASLDRQDRPFDPNYFPQVSGGRMLKPDYAKVVARQIAKRVRTKGETTHLSVMDSEGKSSPIAASNVVTLKKGIAVPSNG